MSDLAEVFPVGDFITEELEARGWTITEVATRMGVCGDAVAAVLSGEPLPDDWPEKLSRVLGTSADVWRKLERRWQRRKGLTGETGPGDARNLGPGCQGHSGPKP